MRFPGPAGMLEGLWKQPPGPPRGSAVFAHPHPLHGGTLHNKVVFRATQALARSGYVTLRFNFRGVGASEGRYDAGRGEVDDVRAAFDEAERTAGLPLVAGGFSFGAAAALRAAASDARISAFIGLGLAVASESEQRLPLPGVPSLFVVGERDPFGPPDALARFVGAAGRVIVIREAGHFFEGHLEALEDAILAFLASLPASAPAREGAVS